MFSTELRSGIHLTVQIGGIRLADAERLVMRRPVGIDRLDRLERGHEILPAAALVAQRPDDDRRMILEILDVRHVAIDDGRLHFRLAVERAVVAVAFDIGLGVEPESVLVAKLVPAGIVGIMARANVIAVGLLQEFDIADHLLFGDDVARFRPVLVPVRSLEFDRRSVYEHLPPFDLDLADARRAERISVGSGFCWFPGPAESTSV